MRSLGLIAVGVIGCAAGCASPSSAAKPDADLRKNTPAEVRQLVRTPASTDKMEATRAEQIAGKPEDLRFDQLAPGPDDLTLDVDQAEGGMDRCDPETGDPAVVGSQDCAPESVRDLAARTRRVRASELELARIRERDVDPRSIDPIDVAKRIGRGDIQGLDAAGAIGRELVEPVPPAPEPEPVPDLIPGIPNLPGVNTVITQGGG